MTYKILISSEININYSNFSSVQFSIALYSKFSIALITVSFTRGRSNKKASPLAVIRNRRLNSVAPLAPLCSVQFSSVQLLCPPNKPTFAARPPAVRAANLGPIASELCCGTPCQLSAERWELAGKTRCTPKFVLCRFHTIAKCRGTIIY